MNSPLIFILAVVVLFILIIVNNLYEKKWTYVIVGISIAIGLVFYSYGYFYISEKSVPAVAISILKSLFATFNMATGKSSLSDISSVPIYKNNVILLIFYLIHLFIYTMVITTLLINFGKRLITSLNNFIRLTFCKNDIYIFYKYTDKVKRVIDKISKDNSQIVIIDDDILNNKDNNFFKFIAKKHCAILNENIFNDENAEKNKKFNKIIDTKGIYNKYLREIFFNNKYANNNIRLYILNEDIEDNYRFIHSLSECIEKVKYKNKIRVTIFMDEKHDLKNLQKGSIFDYVRVFNEKEIMARVLVKNYPPSKYIEFENYKAKQNESFNALIIGFGSISQKILKKLYIYGHFVHTYFNVDIIDKNYDDISGPFNYDFKFLNDDRIYLNKWSNINHKSIDARSAEFYKYFDENKKRLEYIVVATGDEKINDEVVKNLIKLRKDNDLKFDLFDCHINRIFVYEHDKEVRKEYNSYDYIIDDSIDLAGKWINFAYSKDEKDKFDDIDVIDKMENKWKNTDAYDKNSSICAADFYTTILKICGHEDNDFENTEYSDEELKRLKEKFKMNGDDSYNSLTAIDHDRWAGYVLLEEGYGYMDDEHWDKRAKDYNSNNAFKIQNDKVNKLHAYLRSMEDLKELYKKERQVTGSDPTMRWNEINNFDMAELVAKNIRKVRDKD